LSDNNEELLEKINDLTVAETLNATDIKYIKEDTKDIKQSVAELSARMESYYVNLDMWWPVKTAVYGLMGGILLTVLVAVLGLVIIPQFNVNSQISPQNQLVHSAEEKAK
jgi:hypothetical protein